MGIHLTHTEEEMAINPTPRKPASKIEIQARIWRAVDKDAIAHRGDVDKAQAERVARKELRRVIDDAKGNP
jgi:hypothetical protein